ncbi:ZIP family metal transporter [Ottowia caeni]|uniref:ZIP family metal transporter n=1 Tax=Ottowia caeni TaxID=2870339 RepID=UPI001E3FB35E
MNETSLMSLPRTWRRRTWVGLFVLLTGTFILTERLWNALSSEPAVWNALLGGSAAALATALGTLPVLFAHRLSDRVQDTFFGFGAGIMLAASVFSLIVPGFEAAKGLGTFGEGLLGPAAMIGTAVVLGACALLKLDNVLPHEHAQPRDDMALARKLRSTWLFVIAIAFHNLPEGLAIGAGYSGSESAHANALTMGIALQNVPEGLIVATALVSAGYRRTISMLVGIVSGLVEPVGAVVGAAVMSHSTALLPWGLGFAAGAMLFVIFHEILPDLVRKGHGTYAVTGLAGGFVLMMNLNALLPN